MSVHAQRALSLIVSIFGTWCVASADEVAISYHKQIRPIFQANCQGCHQPAKASGGYVMTAFDRLVGAGESEEAAIVPGKPDESHLLREITPNAEGKAKMPKGKPALNVIEVDLIRQWIAQGAVDDTPANAVNRIDKDHPPVYSRQPVITSIDYSPDGQFVAVAGFHEVLIHKADGSGLHARLVGLSERIESARFSPDGKRLAVSGGLPGRTGELQIWDLEKQELTLSLPLTFDTIYGASWTPDGKLVAIGGSDKVVRGFDSTTGEQVFFNMAHDDWAVDTVFSVDGSLLVSVGRDMTAKLYDVKTQRFIDNITSITPGALKGGLQTVARHPMRDEILIGGSDGVPRIYRMQRITSRAIGDDANLMRQFPAMRGRIFGADFAPDGKRIVAGSSLDGKGQVFIYSSDFDGAMPDDIKGIVGKVASSQSAEEAKRLKDYVTSDVKLLTQTEIPAGVYSVAFSPDGNTVLCAGADGLLRFINAADGTITREVPSVTADPATAGQSAIAAVIPSDDVIGPEQIPSGTTVTAIEVTPSELQLAGKFSYAQVLVTATLDSGDKVDVTRLSQFALSGSAGASPSQVARVTSLGRLHAVADGQANLEIKLNGQVAAIPVTVSACGDSGKLSYIRDVTPVISRLGCNAGTCHGAKDGKNGFKLSLRGYDPIYDLRAFTDDLASRRVNVASPDDSLMLLKATGAVPHVGSQVTAPGSDYYQILRRWIAEGATLDLESPRVAKIEVQPLNPIIQQIGAKQQMRVVATYTDGLQKDVTRECFLDSGNTEVAVTNLHGVATTVRRGEAPILVRYEGAYAATTVTAMGDRTGFAWQAPPAYSEIDNLVAAKLLRMKLLPSDLCTDEEYIRRVYLDLTGLPPSVDEVRAFVADSREQRTKREEIVDKLIGNDAFIDFWSNKWADMLQVNGKFLGGEGAGIFRNWIRAEVAANTPYDQLCYKIITASGSNKENPPASYYKTLRDPDLMMENTTHLFLAVRFNCNKCHDHPFERWTQDQYYQTTAYFARVGLQRDPKNPAGDIGGTAVEGAKPLWEEIAEKPEGETTHLRTNAVAPPTFPYAAKNEVPENATRREQLAKWITSPDNQYFAKSYVNRVWGYLLGVGLIEPLDDIRAGNPATNPELLDHLTKTFIDSGFNVRELMRGICKSRTYQLSVKSNDWNADDTTNYSHAVARRLPAEVLFDSLHAVLGAKTNIPGLPQGARAATIPDSGTDLADGFLATTGRPVRESACECERSSGMQLGAVMAMMSGPTVGDAISQADNAIAQLVAKEVDNTKLVDEIVMRILSRPARPQEVEAVSTLIQEMQNQHSALTAEFAAHSQEIAPVTAAKEATRQAGIATAQAAHDAHYATIKEADEAAEKAFQERLAVAKKSVEDHQASENDRLAAWSVAVSGAGAIWTPFDIKDMRTTTGAELKKEGDLSILATGALTSTGSYFLATEANLKDVTGFRLEAIADPSIPANGPGRSGGGNFVLTEFTITAWPPGKPEEKQQIKLRSAKSTFNQSGYDVVTAIDGVSTGQANGWAVYGGVGVNQTATFETETKLAFDGPMIIEFEMNHQYDANHMIGKFRLSSTAAPPPLLFGVPENISQVLAVAVEQRNDEQKKTLLEYFRSQDEDLKKRQAELTAAQMPRVLDAKLVQFKAALTDAQTPLPIDPKYARLERSVKLSEGQLQNARLTAAQDLAWALINSPAFLFNR